jgi:hypothetical protein
MLWSIPAIKYLPKLEISFKLPISRAITPQAILFCQNEFRPIKSFGTLLNELLNTVERASNFSSSFPIIVNAWGIVSIIWDNPYKGLFAIFSSRAAIAGVAFDDSPYFLCFGIFIV